MQIIGKQTVDYVSRKTGKQVSGVNIFVTYPYKSCVGLCAERIYISANSDNFDLIVSLPIGEEVRPTYNRYGDVEQLIPVVQDKGK